MWTRPVADRLKVNAAGIYFNALVAGSVSLASYFELFSPFWIALFWLFSFCNYLIILTNLSSFLEYDGYYILMDLLDKPNLRAHSYIWLVEKFPNLGKKDILKNHSKELIYWSYTLAYMCLSIVTTQVIVVDIVWPLLGWSDSSNIWFLLARFSLIFLVLFLAVKSVLREARQFQAIKSVN